MRTIAFALLVAGLLATAAAVSGAQSPKVGAAGLSVKPPPVYVGAKGQYVRASQGTFCYSRDTPSGEGVGLCADYGYPLRIKARLPVSGGQRLRIDAGRRVKRLSASLVQAEAELFGEITYLRGVKVRRTGQGRFWRLRLPAQVSEANVLSIDVEFESRGDSNVWAGLAPVTQVSPEARGYHRGGPLSQLVRRPAF